MAFGVSGADNIEIRIQVDSTGAVKILGDTEKKIEDVGKATKKASEETNSFFDGFAKGALKGFATFKTFQAAVNSLQIGSQYDDLIRSFETLSNQVGATSSVILGDLRRATEGAVSDFNLMKMANENMLAGLDPDKFGEVAEQVKKLADATGTDYLQALDMVNQALNTGNSRILEKRLRLNVDVEASERSLKAAYGDTTAELTEAGKQAAGTAAIYEALKTNTENLGKANQDAGEMIDKITASFANAGLNTFRYVATNEELVRALEAVSKAADGLLIAIDSASGAFRIFNPLIDATAQALDYAAERMIDVYSGFQKLGEWAGISSEAVKDNNQNLYAALDILDEKTSAQKEEQKTVKAMIKMYGDQNGMIKTTAKEQKKVIDAIFEAEGGYKKLLDAMLKGTISQDRFNTEVKELEKTAKAAKVPVDELSKALGVTLDKALSDNEKSIQDVETKLGDLQQAAKDAAQAMADAAPVFSQVFGGLGIGNSDLSISIAGSMEQALAEGISLALSGLGNSEDYRATATQLGGEIGTAIGGPVIGAFAEQLTNDIVNIGNSSRESFRGVASAMFGPMGGAIADGMFGSSFEDSAGTALKKALDKVIGDAYQDLTFSGNQDPTQGIFAGLGTQAQEQFSMAGDALTTFLGGSTELGVNLGVVFANNNIHLSELAEIVESVGGSFESLANQMLMAFYEGELGVIQLQDQLEELYGIMEGTSTFEDLGAAVQSALSADGRVLLNSIKAIGVEAQQLGAVTLPQMADILVNRFGIAASQVQVIMSSMTAAGISSVAQLAEATKLTSTAIAANIGMAQQGLTPNNSPVIPLAAPSTSGGGGSARSGGGSAASKIANDAKRKAEDQKRKFLQLLNQAQNSAAGRELEKAMKEGAMSDGQYADEIKLLTDAASKAQKALDDAEKNYASTRNKGAEKQKKALEDLLKAQKNLDKVLGVSTGAKSIEVNSGFLSFAEKFASNIQLIEKAAAAAGVKFDDMREKALKAFLAGDKTFSEARQMLADSGKGVSGKQGAVGEVLTRLLSRGESGGIFSIDDLKGLAEEAKELGADTLEGLFEGLSGQGASQKDQQALSIALQNAGVTTLEQLEGISTEVAINVLDIMKQSGAQFSQTSSELRDIAKQISEIPNSKKVTIELDGSLSPALAAILARFDMLPEGLEQINSGTTYEDTSLGLKKQARAEYKRLMKLGKKTKAANYKANNAQYF